jgi:hypothetical protein
MTQTFVHFKPLLTHKYTHRQKTLQSTFIPMHNPAIAYIST